MRRAARLAVPAALLAGPTVLAFFQGGYFTAPRLGALVVAALLLAGAASVALRGSDPSTRASRAVVVASVAFVLLVVWTAVSQAWAPVEATAIDTRERTLLYLLAFGAAAFAFRERRAVAWVEPALLAGIVVCIGYGLLDLLELVDLQDSAAAGGRLYHPLTYWNAEGALAGMGLVLAARLAGTGTRPRAQRLAAAAATPLLGLGLYLTFSRGALTATAVGLAVLLALTPTWSQLRAIAIAFEGVALAAVAAEVLPRDVLVLPLLALMLLAAALQEWSAQAEGEAATALGPLPALGKVRLLAWVAAAVLLVAPFTAAPLNRDGAAPDPAFGATAARLASAGSDRFAYWEVALRTFADDPAIGAGAGAFATEWVKRRETPEAVRDGHSLWLETAAELGVVGVALLALLFGGVAVAAARSARTDPRLAAGPIAALGVWVAHSAIDWDWEMPALTLVAAVLAGVLAAGDA